MECGESCALAQRLVVKKCKHHCDQPGPASAVLRKDAGRLGTIYIRPAKVTTMPSPKVMAVVVTEAPLDEVRAAAAAHDFSLAVEPADEPHAAGAPSARRYEVILANGTVPRPNVARTLLAELSSLWPATIIDEPS